jgi:translation initiation factor 2B subunit (eIF-2B alpha/beta/delta family)
MSDYERESLAAEAKLAAGKKQVEKMSCVAILRQFSEFLCKNDHPSDENCCTINNHEGQEVYSQTGTSCSLPYLWRGTRRKVRTHNGKGPQRASS